ncbi:hypothetical protein GCM10010982_00960 [Bowmanella pacifica]|uniref:Uncharacterized protein n=2 Tax=Bowmanella pacifica TaxID=502051 RepID=A0A917YPY2_9ALTE|nr:hypothetical protein GCM10010982_00960 [Bowmanella pacifica]
MIAQCLAKGGMRMGEDLMGASFSNPLGHLEDMPVVRLHDKIFEINGTNWQYCDDSQLIKPSWLQNYLIRYIQGRTQDNIIQGVKDPRAVYFLDDWEIAGQQAIKYIFIYRHWANAAQSLLNRASRHLINSMAPIAANRVNYRFWQQPDLAFQMWLSSNQRMLNFYLAHPDKCVLIAQEGFASGGFEAQPLADKLALPVSCLTPSEFKPELMTSTLDADAVAFIGDDLRKQLDELWQRLQNHAQVPAPGSCSSPYSVADHPHKPVAKPGELSHQGFKLDGLTWAELLGFLSSIPHKLLQPELFSDGFRRPYGSVEQFLSLAKITHNAGFYALTKLARLRAMQVHTGHWRIEQWDLFSDKCDDWYHKDDASLPQVIPFSLRPIGERELGVLPLIDGLADIGERELLARIAKLATPAARKVIEATLLYKPLSRPELFHQLSQLAQKVRAYELAELAMIKALRMDYQVDYLVGLGDIYYQQKLFNQALQVLEEASALSPSQVAIQVRLAQVHNALGNKESYALFKRQAQSLAPNHPMVKRWLVDKQPTSAESEVISSPANLLARQCYEVLSYEEVLKVVQANKAEGQTLDLHNLRVGFLLRDNQAWLEDANRTLSCSGATHLRTSIYRQWQKLWPRPLLNSYLGLPLDRPAYTQNKSIGATGTPMALYIDTQDPQRLQALLSLVNCHKVQIELHIVTTTEQQSEIEQLVEGWSGKVHINSLPSGYPEAKAWLACCSAALAGYPAVAKLHTYSDAPVGQICNRLLAQWYGLLGTDELLNKALSFFSHNEPAALLVPPYLPQHAELLLQESWLTAQQQKCKKYGLPEPSERVIVPTDKMFWYSPAALNTLPWPEELVEDTDFYTLLPTVLEQAEKVTQSIQLV